MQTNALVGLDQNQPLNVGHKKNRQKAPGRNFGV